MCSSDLLATQIIIANERIRDTLPPSRVQAESRKITITESGLEEVRKGRYGRVQLPSWKKPATGSNNGAKPLRPRKRLRNARTSFGENLQR